MTKNGYLLNLIRSDSRISRSLENGQTKWTSINIESRVKEINSGPSKTIEWIGGVIGYLEFEDEHDMRMRLEIIEEMTGSEGDRVGFSSGHEGGVQLLAE